MDIVLGSSMILKALKMERDAMLHMQWCVQLPFMSKDNYIGFNEYRDSVTGANIDNRPTEVLLAEVEEIERQMRGDHGNI